jgi:HAD superfamily hydrolase (TIGR01549 family)
MRAVLLDLDDTLFDRVPVFLRWAHGFLGRWSLDGRELAALIELDAGGRTHHRDLMTAMVARYGLDADPEALAAQMPDELAASLEPEPGFAEAMAALGARFRLGVVTNGPSALQRSKLARLGITDALGAIAISAEVGVAKPDPQIFAFALERLGCDPRDAMMVGDHWDKDLAPARALGMATVMVDRSGRPGSEVAPLATHVVPSLAALVPLLS